MRSYFLPKDCTEVLRILLMCCDVILLHILASLSKPSLQEALVIAEHLKAHHSDDVVSVLQWLMAIEERSSFFLTILLQTLRVCHIFYSD